MNQGFSIVEALVIIVIIGILATLGYSRYNYHVAKTRQSEAKHTLHHLIQLQESYLLEHNKYSWLKSIGLKKGGGHACSKSTPGEEMMNELGFRPKNCKELRYEYWMPPDNDDPSKPRHNIDGNPPVFMIRADNIPSRSGVYIWPDCNQRDWWKGHSDGRVHQPYEHTPPRNVLEACK